METKQEEALETLRQKTALFKEIKNLVEKSMGELSSIDYYKKFRFHIDAPSVLPIEIVKDFTIEMSNFKKEIIEFKKSFNENDLPEDLRQTFMQIFIILVKPSLYVKNGDVILGEVGGSWKKPTAYIVNVWDNMEYEIKYTYSKQAFTEICSYFDLVRLIKKMQIE